MDSFWTYSYKISIFVKKIFKFRKKNRDFNKKKMDLRTEPN